MPENKNSPGRGRGNRGKEEGRKKGGQEEERRDSGKEEAQKEGTKEEGRRKGGTRLRKQFMLRNTSPPYEG